jgi:glycerol-3-phosphate acyltransferase PlsY
MGAAVAAILGHIFPVWLRFRGGKGVASALGVMIGLAPWGAVGILSVFLVVVVLTRYVSLGSVLGAATFPFFGLYFAPERSPIAIAGFFLIAVLVIAKHHQNIQRLLKGTESRFGSGKATA